MKTKFTAMLPSVFALALVSLSCAGTPNGPAPHGKTPLASNADVKAEAKHIHENFGWGGGELQWLADHQNPAGYWSPDEYHKDSIRIGKGAKITRNIDTDDVIKREDDLGQQHFQLGLTGLSVLAFISDGHTSEVGDFRLTIKRAARYLIGTQDAEGCFGSREHDAYVYNHAICTMAFAELYAMTGVPPFKSVAQRGVDFIIASQNPGMGWRYGVKPGENDSSVTAWMILALKSASIADLTFDSVKAYAGANAWFDKVEGKDENGYLATGYHSPASGNARPGQREDWEQNSAMDACNLMVRLFTGKYKPSSDEAKVLAARLTSNLPTWREEGSDGTMNARKVDFYYWYFGSLAAFQMGGETWQTWEKALINPILLKYQRGWHPEDLKVFEEELKVHGAESKNIQKRHILDEYGSWDPLGPWGWSGGRVYATAINALTLEVYYRYARVGDGK